MPPKFSSMFPLYFGSLFFNNIRPISTPITIAETAATNPNPNIASELGDGVTRSASAGCAFARKNVTDNNRSNFMLPAAAIESSYKNRSLEGGQTKPGRPRREIGRSPAVKRGEGGF